jgi:Protein of unknown function (DUF4019)
MQRGVALFVGALAIFLAGCATHSPSKSRTEKRADEAAARIAAEKWIRLLDDGDYEEAFEWEAQDFRMSRTQNQFVRYMQARRQPFGQTLSRTFIGAASIQKLVGLPDGNYESIIFKTIFEHKSATAERVILVKQPVGWRVIDYRIY